jgi:hypothetical protein
MATIGTNSFNVLIFIAVQLFAKFSANATDRIRRRRHLDILQVMNQRGE